MVDAQDEAEVDVFFVPPGSRVLIPVAAAGGYDAGTTVGGDTPRATVENRSKWVL